MTPISVYDNVLDDTTFKRLHNYILYSIQWDLVPAVNYDDDGGYLFASTPLFEKHNNTSKDFDKLKPLYNFLVKEDNMTGLIRVRIICMPLQHNKPDFKWHTDLLDYDKPYKTAIFYLNTTDGPTIVGEPDNQVMYEEVEMKANRMVIMDGNQPHTGTNHTNCHYRLLVNINYVND